MTPSQTAIALMAIAIGLNSYCILMFVRNKRQQVRFFVKTYYAIVVIGFVVGALLGGGLWLAPSGILTFPSSWLLSYLVYPAWFYTLFLASFIEMVGVGAPINALVIMFLSRFVKD